MDASSTPYNVMAVFTCSPDGLTAKQLWNSSDGTMTSGDGTTITSIPKYRKLQLCNSGSTLRLLYMMRQTSASGATLRVSSTRNFQLAPGESVEYDVGESVEFTFLASGAGAGTTDVTVVALG